MFSIRTEPQYDGNHLVIISGFLLSTPSSLHSVTPFTFTSITAHTHTHTHAHTHTLSRLCVAHLNKSTLLNQSQVSRPCPSPTPRVHTNPCPSSQWCHSIISSSVIPFSSCPQSFPASGSFPMSQYFPSGGQSIGASAWKDISPSNEHLGLITFRMDWLELLAVPGTLKSLLQHHNSKESILWWVWVNSGSWWWTGRPSVLQFMGWQRVRHDWATEVNWTEN